MFKSFVIAAFLGLAATTQANAVPADGMTFVEFINTIIDGTNFIVNGNCSGTLIDTTDRLVLTNYHCIDQNVKVKEKKVVGEDGRVSTVQYEDLQTVELSQRFYDGHDIVSSSSYAANILAYDKGVDLALVQFKQAKIPYGVATQIFPGDSVVRGQEVFVVGNPLGLDATLTRGIISNINRKLSVGGEEYDYIQVDAGITGGNSGGALYDEQGYMIGVPAAGARGNTHIGLAIPFTDIRNFLDENCWGSAWNEEAESHDECIETKQEVEKEAN